MSLTPLQPVALNADPLFGAYKPKTYKRYYVPSVKDTFSYKSGDQTHVESLIGGGQIFGKVDEMLKMARSTVLVDLYNFQSPALYPEKSSPVGTAGADIQAQLVDKLIQLKRDKNVNIKVIIDNHWDPEFNEGQNNRVIDHLRKNGIDVVTYPDFSTISHVKVLIVDGKYVMIGGMNWGNHSPTNHDAAVFIEGPDVRNIYNQVFKPDWVSSGREPSELPRWGNFAPGKIKVLQTTAKESSDGPKDEIFREILHQIANAKESIHAELFNLTQPYVAEALLFAHKRLTAAGKEGVKILVDPGLFFAFPGVRPKVQQLAKAGVPVRFFEANRDIEEKLHAKWAVFDRKRVLIGSANWSSAGLLTNGEDQAEEGQPKQRLSRSNHEVALLIESTKLGRAFASQATWDFNNASFPILEYREDLGKWKPIRPDTPAAAAAASKKSNPPPPVVKRDPAAVISPFKAEAVTQTLRA